MVLVFGEYRVAKIIEMLSKEEKAKVQKVLDAVKEKEQLLIGQKAKLEKEVELRTEELNHTLSELKLAQTQLVQSEKMASIGVLTAGIAHEINNPLSYMQQSVEILREDLKDVKSLIFKYDEVDKDNVAQKIKDVMHYKEQINVDLLYTEIDRSLEDIEDGIQRTETITKGLKTFSRLDESSYKETDIEKNIDSTLQFIKHELKKKQIKIKKAYGKTQKITCNPGKLNQVFMNLLINAIYAIEHREDKTEEGFIAIKTEIVGRKLVIAFEDNGNGMTDETKQKIFDPFYTTKDVGEGTGLGMSIVHGIVENHQGSMQIESTFKKGSIIRICLPLNPIETVLRVVKD